MCLLSAEPLIYIQTYTLFIFILPEHCDPEIESEANEKQCLSNPSNTQLEVIKQISIDA